MSRPPSPAAERAAALAVAGAALAFAVFHSVVAGLTWRSLRSDWPLDLAYFVTQVSSFARGAGFAQTLHWHESQSLFGNTHFNPILLLAVPLQWLAPGLDSLLALQCALVALGGVAASRLARSHGAGPALSAGAGLLFLLQAPLWRVVQADVRPLVWSIPFLLMLAAALTEGRRREALTWALLACLCREELPVIVAGLAALWAAGRAPTFRRRWAPAAAVGLASLGLLFAASLVRPASDTYIEPHMWLLEATGWGLRLPRGVGPEPEFVHRFPERMSWLLGWAFPAGLLALLAPRLLLATVPLLGYLLTTSVGWASWDGDGSHYTAPAIALVGGAAAVALGRLAGERETGPFPFFGAPRSASTRAPRLAWAALLAVLALESTQAVSATRGWIADDTRPAREGAPEAQAVRALVASVPPDAPVAADFITVHLFAPRETLYCYERDAMKGFDVAAPGPLLPERDPQPRWALILSRQPEWIGRAARSGLVERGHSELYVLMGPSDVPSVLDQQ